MPKLKQCVILNPNAGSAARAEAGLDRLGPHELLKTKDPGDGKEMARRAVQDGYQRVIAAGGDGTLNEVLNGMAAGFGRVQLGLIPLGTANDFARSVGIPADVDQAIDVLVAGKTKRVDVVSITASPGEKHHFINVSAGGFSTLVSEKLEKETKYWWGSLAYGLSALKALPDMEQYVIQATFDDEPAVRLPVYNLVVANARFVGGGIPVAPRARLDDGLFDVVIFRAVSMARLTTLVPKALLGKHMDDEDVLFRQVRRFEIASDPPFALNTDGEIVGSPPAVFECLPQAIEMVIGAEPEIAE